MMEAIIDGYQHDNAMLRAAVRLLLTPSTEHAELVARALQSAEEHAENLEQLARGVLQNEPSNASGKQTRMRLEDRAELALRRRAAQVKVRKTPEEVLEQLSEASDSTDALSSESEEEDVRDPEGRLPLVATAVALISESARAKQGGAEHSGWRAEASRPMDEAPESVAASEGTEPVIAQFHAHEDCWQLLLPDGDARSGEVLPTSRSGAVVDLRGDTWTGKIRFASEREARRALRRLRI